MTNPKYGKKLVKMWLTKEENNALENWLKFKSKDLIGELIIKINERRELN